MGASQTTQPPNTYVSVRLIAGSEADVNSIPVIFASLDIRARRGRSCIRASADEERIDVILKVQAQLKILFGLARPECRTLKEVFWNVPSRLPKSCGMK